MWGCVWRVGRGREGGGGQGGGKGLVVPEMPGNVGGVCLWGCEKRQHDLS